MIKYLLKKGLPFIFGDIISGPDRKKNTVLGIDENIEATLTYLFGFLSGLIFLLIERKNYFVKFHALQSFVTFLGLWILSFFLTYLPYVGVLLIFLLNGLSILFWLLGMYKAYQGKAYRFPIVGSFAERQLYRI